ncbi:hypothetical protein AB0890_07240 [Streptomyces sp. NPDC005406]|uniref:hypothetical protein n=1 Tax=Streptomyces sp. NPDC005406 TaxID=3155339 RepID=UPI00345385F5
MRQLPVPVRWAAVTAVTIAASTGCMSIGSDGGKPAPSGSAVPKGAVAEPDGSTVAGTGRARTGGGSGAHSERRAGRSANPSASAAPSGGPGAEPGRPGPAKPGHPAAQSPSAQESGAPEQPEPPAPSDPGPGTPGSQQPSTPPPPDPEPSDPEPPAPSASPAAQLRDGATGTPDAVYALRTPEASPQVGPA